MTPIRCGLCGYAFPPEHAALFIEGADIGFPTAKLYSKDDPEAPNVFYRTDRHENDPEHIIHRCSSCHQCARAFA